MTQWHIDRLGHLGDGMARAPGQQALAPLTLPGEIIEGQSLDGRITAPRILTPSPDRVRPVCAHFRSCGGCSVMHGSDAFVAEWKVGIVKRALAAQGIEVPISGLATSPPRSRRRAVFSGRRTKKGALVGFHQRASDVIVDITDCHVIRDRIGAVLPFLRRIIMIGGSRQAELSLIVSDGPNGLDVSVTGGKALDPALLTDLTAIAREADLARLSWNDESITRRPPFQQFGKAQVVPPPGAFLQATKEGEAALLSVLRDITAGASKILDLFAGCGTFTLPLAERADLHAVEGLAPPLMALDQAWRRTSGLHRITTESRDLTRRPVMSDELRGYDAIVIDPPRTGAKAQAAEIARSPVNIVGWISCDPVTFSADARIMTEGGYHLRRLFVVDQFRWSHHIETIAEFRRG